MFSDPYVEALLVAEEVADLVWEVWDRNKLSKENARLAWILISLRDINT